MWNYQAPLRDMQFVINRWLESGSSWAALPGFAGLDSETTAQLLAEAARFASAVLEPTNAGGDLEGCRYDYDGVATPAGFREAYRTFVEAGWPTLACAPEVGGQGLPRLLNTALYEMLCSANHAWSMYSGLAHGAYECIRRHGPTWMQAQYLPKIVSGHWLATMCLTEAHAGSDLGLLRTRAEPAESYPNDGHFRISGTKTFISGGEHDLTDNIVHLVLARIHGMPAGTKGISLFLVPKWLEDGDSRRANGVYCDGIEDKMGIKGSATCTLRFEQSSGWLLGERNRGLAAMFVMMNASRLHVAVQGVAHAEAVYQNGLRYATERCQMRAIKRPPSVSVQAADPIILHPMIRRTLLKARAMVEGERVLAYWAAHLLDTAAEHPDQPMRNSADHLASLLTPILKSFLTEQGFTLASEALQIWGGHGYLRESRIEQHVRDARVAMIYEGTNEVQAIDLLVRKVLSDKAATLARLMTLIESEAVACAALDATAYAAAALRTSLTTLQLLTTGLIEDAERDPEQPHRVADNYLRACALLLMAYAWARTLRLVIADTDEFGAQKRETAQFFFDQIMPEFNYRCALISAACRALPFVAALAE
jgi:alkylation response protein AidB-like acyl-CoA dehydrogenase